MLWDDIFRKLERLESNLDTGPDTLALMLTAGSIQDIKIENVHNIIQVYWTGRGTEGALSLIKGKKLIYSRIYMDETWV